MTDQKLLTSLADLEGAVRALRLYFDLRGADNDRLRDEIAELHLRVMKLETALAQTKHGRGLPREGSAEMSADSMKDRIAEGAAPPRWPETPDERTAVWDLLERTLTHPERIYDTTTIGMLRTYVDAYLEGFRGTRL